MFSFRIYAELLEAKVDDLSAKYPDHAEAIQQYNRADPTTTKKFLPWLVRQHIKGHVKPDDPRLGATLENFDRYVSKLPAADHNSYSYNDLADKVGEHIQKEMERKRNQSDIKQVYNNGGTGVTAQHIRTKEAAQKLYGGGKGCGKTGTNWCIAARGSGNLWGHYGPTYTIHKEGDPNSPYAVHPMSNKGPTITNRHNDGDRPAATVVHNNPDLKAATDAILHHSAGNINSYLHSDNPSLRMMAINHPLATQDHLAQALSSNQPEEVRAAAAKHDKVSGDLLDKALSDKVPRIRQAALTNNNITSKHIEHVQLNEKRPEVRAQAAKHPAATSEQIHRAMDEQKYPEIRRAAMQNPSASVEHLAKGIVDPDQGVRVTAASHKNMNSELIKKAKDHEHGTDALKIYLRGDAATHDDLMQGLGHPDREVRAAAIKNPSITSEHIEKAMKDPDIAHTAIEHRNATPEQISRVLDRDSASDERLHLPISRRSDLTPEHIDKILKGKNIKSWATRRAAEHPLASQQTLEHVMTHHADPDTRAIAYQAGIKRFPKQAAQYAQQGMQTKPTLSTGAWGEAVNNHIKAAVISHKSVTGEQLLASIRDHKEPNNVVREALRNKNITKAHLNAVLDRPLGRSYFAYENVKKAMNHKQADSSIVARGLNSDNAEINKIAIKSKHTTPEQISNHLTPDTNPIVAKYAAGHKNATAENITQALGHRLMSVRKAALLNRNRTQDHIRQATNDRDVRIRNLAHSMLETA